jgi:hypothetical protein
MVLVLHAATKHSLHTDITTPHYYVTILKRPSAAPNTTAFLHPSPSPPSLSVIPVNNYNFTSLIKVFSPPPARPKRKPVFVLRPCRVFYDLESGLSAPAGRHGAGQTGSYSGGSLDSVPPKPRLFVVNRDGSGWEILPSNEVPELASKADDTNIKVRNCPSPSALPNFQ